MTKPTFNMQISLGSVLQICALLVAVTAGWMRYEAGIAANSRSVENLTSKVAATEDRTRDLEQNFVRQDERMTSIFALLSRIDSRLERIEMRNGDGR
ncbi:hypothetical protein [Roseobacter sp. AzwK-3b]|uniref:hypothetical protein n=1 Tax=Roseobacter sp. AzwK-3b TaxID=351016 RepID=UPI0012F47A86|nr:hypothetical protein [Roseobacter sp. AzwK-3b]